MGGIIRALAKIKYDYLINMHSSPLQALRLDHTLTLNTFYNLGI
jgi:hypothetical protein